MKIILTICLTIVIFTSCTSTHSTEYEWMNVDSLHSISLQPDSSMVGCYKITLIDSTTIVLHDLYAQKNKHYRCYNISKDSLIWMGDFLNLGRGPMEALQSVIMVDENKYLYIFTSPQSVQIQSIYQVPIDETISNVFNTTMYNTISVPSNNSISAICPIDSANFLVSQIHNNNSMFSCFDIKDSIIVDLQLNYPDDGSSASYYTKSMIYSGAILKHSEKSRFVYSSFYGNYVMIFDIINGKIENIKTIFNKYPVYEINPDGSSFTSLPESLKGMNVCISNKYIYLLNKYNKNRGNEVMVFNWEGTPIRKLILDKDVSYIAVDNSNSTIFAFIRASENNNEELIKIKL